MQTATHRTHVQPRPPSGLSVQLYLIQPLAYDLALGIMWRRLQLVSCCLKVALRLQTVVNNLHSHSLHALHHFCFDNMLHLFPCGKHPTLTFSSHRTLSPANPDTSLAARSSRSSVSSAFFRSSSLWASFSSYCRCSSSSLSFTSRNFSLASWRMACFSASLRFASSSF